MRVARLSGWGRYPTADCRLAHPSRALDALEAIAEAPSLIARGCGRSYGDSSLNHDLTLATNGIDRFLSFDPVSGVIECEAGLCLTELINVFLPRGWLSPVTPGTQFVTIGGMIAADVHGKNHHSEGSFCDYLAWLELGLPDGRVERCSHELNADLFAATCGGMGLTGVILRAAFRMKRVESAHVRQRAVRAENLDAAMRIMEETLGWTYSVAWLDCLARGGSLGRSIVFLGEHARPDELPPEQRATPFFRRPRRAKRVPIDLPAFALGPASVRLFNALYYRAPRPLEGLIDFESCFYPLDAIQDWNKIYGRRGLLQYQCVLPLESSREGMKALLDQISSTGSGSFLAVLKRTGHQSFGHLSFPMPGYSLALDFPVSQSSLMLLDRLDQIMLEHGGRLYLAKDARAQANIVKAGYPRLSEFQDVRRRWGLEDKFHSLQSQRLEL